MKREIPTTAAVVVLVVVMLTGCDENKEVARVATEAAERQAEQNQEMAQLNREVAEGTKLLVEADAEARESVLAMQADLYAEQAEIGQQRDQLEAERREIADHRLRESLLAPIINNLGPLLVVVAVLFFCGAMVSGLDDGDDEVSEVLIEELAADRPVLLPPTPSAGSIERDGHKPAATGDLPDLLGDS